MYIHIKEKDLFQKKIICNRGKVKKRIYFHEEKDLQKKSFSTFLRNSKRNEKKRKGFLPSQQKRDWN